MTSETTKSTSKRIQEILRNMLVEQKIEPGSHLVEMQLCSQLGVSRTPIREALFKLEEEGFVKSDLACGFTVRDLNAREVKELYPIIWTLETLALRLSSQCLQELLPKLRSINKQFSGSKENIKKMVSLDSRFHETLTSECRNRYLLRQLKILRRLILRYEHAYMGTGTWCEESTEQHNQIIDAIAKSKLDLAIQVLEDNWRKGMERIASWLEWKTWEEEKK